MLEGLEKIDWSKLSHAFGAADDVPGLLWALASDDPDARKEAVSEFFGNIWHQGTVYEATAYAVPFLLELLGSPEVGGKDEIMVLLAHLAKGDSYHDVHRDHLLLKEKTNEPEFLEKVEKEIRWVRDAKSAVRLGENLYVRFLDDPEIILRDATAYLMGSLEGPSQKLADAIWRRFEKEDEEQVQVSLLLAIGFLAARNNSNIGALLAVLVDENSRSVKLASAMSLVRLAPGEPSEESLSILLEAARFPEGYDALARSIWAQVVDFEFLVTNQCTLLEGAAAQAAESRLADLLPTQTNAEALRIAEILLTIAFGASIGRHATFASLNEQQQRIVKLIAESRNVWIEEIGKDQTSGVKISMLLRSCGLPDQFAKLVSFIYP